MLSYLRRQVSIAFIPGSVFTTDETDQTDYGKRHFLSVKSVKSADKILSLKAMDASLR